jgi:hypothetical protein
MVSIYEYLSANPYPGRGVAIGKTADGTKAVILYFIMGRSVNSRNRIFELTDDGIRTRAFDPSKLSDPSLIIYAPVRKVGLDTVVTNGDQTDTVRDALQAGKTFAEASVPVSLSPMLPTLLPASAAFSISRAARCPTSFPFSKNLPIATAVTVCSTSTPFPQTA